MTRERAVTAVLFLGFAVATLIDDGHTPRDRFLLMLLVVWGAGFSRGPVSRVIAIVSLLAGWFGRPWAGHVLMGMFWFVRSSIDRGREMKGRELSRQAVAPPSPSEPPPDPPVPTADDAEEEGGPPHVEVSLDARLPFARAKALRRAGPDALARVRAALGDPSWEVRQAAAKALGRLLAEGAVDQLEARTDDPHQEVAAAARTALKQIQGATSSRSQGRP